jgi:hypothetical protein
MTYHKRHIWNKWKSRISKYCQRDQRWVECQYNQIYQDGSLDICVIVFEVACDLTRENVIEMEGAEKINKRESNRTIFKSDFPYPLFYLYVSPYVMCVCLIILFCFPIFYYILLFQISRLLLWESFIYVSTCFLEIIIPQWLPEILLPWVIFTYTSRCPFLQIFLLCICGKSLNLCISQPK